MEGQEDIAYNNCQASPAATHSPCGENAFISLHRYCSNR